MSVINDKPEWASDLYWAISFQLERAVGAKIWNPVQQESRKKLGYNEEAMLADRFFTSQNRDTIFYNSESRDKMYDMNCAIASAVEQNIGGDN